MNSVRGTTSSCATKAKRPGDDDKLERNNSVWPGHYACWKQTEKWLIFSSYLADTFPSRPHANLLKRQFSETKDFGVVISVRDLAARTSWPILTIQWPVSHQSTRRTTPLTLVSYSKIKKKNQKTAAIQQGDAAALVGDDETNRAEKFTS